MLLSVKRVGCGIPGLLKQADEGGESLAAEMSKLTLMQVGELIIQLSQQSKARIRDAQHDNAAIGVGALTRDEAGFDQAVGQAGHVGIVADQALGDLAAR